MRSDVGFKRIIEHVRVLAEACGIEMDYLACRSKAELGLCDFDEGDWQVKMVDASMEAQGHGYRDFQARINTVPPTYKVIPILEDAWGDGYCFAETFGNEDE
ncbi:hypothetical protein ACQHIH_21625 (plasmid) [Xanthomonas sontii]|uniref:hypothetical protein n=1 Tax=Xanthomonas sontii TaxID=2650745 RepID=UPI003F84BA46